MSSMGGIAPGDRFAGIVVSENVTEIKKDSEKTVKELLVRAGDDVKKGQVLFSYDTEEVQLTLDKQRLELEQLQGTLESHKSKINTLQWQSNNTSGTTKLKYTLEIQSAQIDLKETEIKIKAKEKEIARSEELLANVDVVSPIDGRIQEVSENGSMIVKQKKYNYKGTDVMILDITNLTTTDYNLTIKVEYANGDGKTPDSPVATVVAAINKALVDGNGIGDTITIKVMGKEVSMGGDVPEYPFNLIVDSYDVAEKTRIDCTDISTIAYGGDTVYKSVNI